jgi:hypothetical protein
VGCSNGKFLSKKVLEFDPAVAKRVREKIQQQSRGHQNRKEHQQHHQEQIDDWNSSVSVVWVIIKRIGLRWDFEFMISYSWERHKEQ